MKVSVPADMCARISARAVQLANESMRNFGWSDKSLSALSPLPGEGRVGIKTSQKYLLHQERGIKPFIMWWVESRVIPLSCKQGDGPHIRRGKEPGQPGWVNIPHVGRVWRDQKWRHPGLPARGFMEKAIIQAVEELQPQLKQQVVAMLRQGAIE